MLKDKTGRKLSPKEVLPKALNRAFNWWLDFELMVLRWIGYLPSHLCRKFFYRLAGMKIGKGSTIHMWARFFYPPGIEIGEDTIIGDHVFLDGRSSLKIGNHTSLASEVMIYNSEHDVHDPEFGVVEESVEIGDYVFIGPRAIILPGIKIGRGAVVAAGAIATKDIPPGKIVAGVPAKVIGERKLKDYQYRLGRARLFQ